MAVIADCPGCMGGHHDQHVEHWGTRPEGIIDGEYCHCPGDCAERVEEAFDRMFGKLLPQVPSTALSPEAEKMLNDIMWGDHATAEAARQKLNQLMEEDPL